MFKSNKNLNKHVLHKNKKKLYKHAFHKNKKKNIPWKKFIICIVFISGIVFIGLVIIMNNYLGKINKVVLNENDLNIKEDISEKKSTFLQNNDIRNIALLGIDEIEGTAGRSDCIMILTLDNTHKEIKVTSILRDSYVVIPNKEKKDKINHAYAFGGSELALKTLNENFNLNLNQFVIMNFSSLPKIIDSIGGITLDITTDELKYINDYINNLNDINYTNSPNVTTSGSQKMDGTQALAYCRIRYTDGGDFERTNRQRTVLTALIEKCKTISASQYSSLLDELYPIVHTNLEKSEILSLTIDFNSLKNQPLLKDRFPRDEDGNGKLIEGIYYYVFDEESTTAKMHKFIFG